DRVVGRGGRAGTISVTPDPSALAALTSAPPPGGALLEVRGAARAFGSLRAVSDVSFTVAAGSITALIGPNGAGKTTLFNLIGGYQPLDAGTVRFRGGPIETLLPDEIALRGIGRPFQNLPLFDNMAVRENVMCGRHRLMTAGLPGISARLPKVPREEADAQRAARAALAFVGLRGAEDVRPSVLPFGHQRLVEVARALALEPTLLLMDEPASRLNDTAAARPAELLLRTCPRRIPAAL